MLTGLSFIILIIKTDLEEYEGCVAIAIVKEFEEPVEIDVISQSFINYDL
jgi:hypothetical protein